MICFPVLLHLFEIIPFYGNIVKYMHRDMQTNTVHSIIKQLQYKEEENLIMRHCKLVHQSQS